MNFFEQELRKIVSPRCSDAAYVGRACYVRLDEMNRAKIQIAAGETAGRYDSLLITILNRNNGAVDSIPLHFTDLLDRDMHAGIYGGCFEWYDGCPSSEEYRKLTEAVGSYLDVFQEQVQTAGQQWQQTM